jgi:hypothetical protein
VADAFQVDSSQLSRHAANVRAVRDQLAAIKNVADFGGRSCGRYAH